MFARILLFLTPIAVTAAVTAVIVIAQVQPESLQWLLDGEQLAEASRPWMEGLHDLGRHELFAPAASVFFFLMILTFAKRSS